MRRPEQTALYCLVRQPTASFIAHTEASTGAERPRFIEDGFDAFLECGILAPGFLRLHCGECGHDQLPAFGWTTSSRMCRCDSGWCRCRCCCVCCWPRSRNWSRQCCSWCSAWSSAIRWGMPGSRLTKATAAPSR
jgi:hypothetical protein